MNNLLKDHVTICRLDGYAAETDVTVARQEVDHTVSK
jgi:hypothetical protein